MGALPLPNNGLIRGATAAARQAKRLYPQARAREVVIEKASLAARDVEPAERNARILCGRRAQNRTVVVELRITGLSASLSQGTVLVARFRDGYYVWSIFH